MRVLLRPYARSLSELMSDRPLRAASLERSLAIIRDLPGVTVKDATLARSEADPARNELTVTIRGRRMLRGVRLHRQSRYRRWRSNAGLFVDQLCIAACAGR